jgi:hypothetical protein
VLKGALAAPSRTPFEVASAWSARLRFSGTRWPRRGVRLRPDERKLILKAGAYAGKA